MSDQSPIGTEPVTGSVDVPTLLWAFAHTFLFIAGTAGLAVGKYTDSYLAPLIGGLSIIIGFVMQVYAHYKTAREKHEIATVSAANGRPLKLTKA